jgi:hypothetical protein
MKFDNKYLKIFIALLLVVALGAISCSDAAEQRADQNDYERGKESILKMEGKNPEKFLSVSSSYKKNLLGQSVVKGKIINTAKLASYKDVVIKLSFFSKTGALLEEDVETIYEKIDARQTKEFKSKFFTHKETSSVTVIVESAIVAK